MCISCGYRQIHLVGRRGVGVGGGVAVAFESVMEILSRFSSNLGPVHISQRFFSIWFRMFHNHTYVFQIRPMLHYIWLDIIYYI